MTFVCWFVGSTTVRMLFDWKWNAQSRSLLVAKWSNDGVVWSGRLFNVLASRLCEFTVDLQCLQLQTQFGLAFAFQIGNNILVLPSDFMWQTTNLAVFTVWPQAQHSQSSWYANTTFLFVDWWNAIEHTQTGQSSLTAQCFVWDHACWKERQRND